ncbi:MAG: transposase [Ktedonobacterales bacterium]|nr:transposase [Ktedonobacterales bacterium]
MRHAAHARWREWLTLIEQRGCEQLRAFAVRLRKDRAAVAAGLTEVWTQGAVEGHVNRVKLIKRSGYGRMSFTTSRQRVLIRQASWAKRGKRSLLADQYKIG